MKNAFMIGEKVYLRGLEKEDINGKYYEWFNDQEVCNYNGHCYFPNNILKMESYLNEVYTNKSLLVLAIINKEDDVHIGNIALENIDWISKSAEYAIILGEKKYWGKGLAKEASDLLLYQGFIRLNLHRIYCGTSEDNLGMQKLADYMGMKQEGIRKEAMYKNGKYKDVYEYGLLREDYLIKVNNKKGNQ